MVIGFRQAVSLDADRGRATREEQGTKSIRVQAGRGREPQNRNEPSNLGGIQGEDGRGSERK